MGEQTSEAVEKIEETGQELETGTTTVESEIDVEQEIVSDETEVDAEAGEDGDPKVGDETPDGRVFTQEEVDKIVAKRLERENRKREREAQQAAEPLKLESKLNPDDYESTEAYIEALADERAELKIKHREAVETANAIEDKFQEQVEVAREKYPDFEQVAYDQSVPITDPMANAIRESDLGAELAYYLGKNKQEAKVIASMSPISQIRALVKLEAKVEAELSKPPGSKAPAPITPGKAGKVVTKTYDTTDPRSVKQFQSATDWIKADRERRRRKLQQQGLK